MDQQAKASQIERNQREQVEVKPIKPKQPPKNIMNELTMTRKLNKTLGIMQNEEGNEELNQENVKIQIVKQKPGHNKSRKKDLFRFRNSNIESESDDNTEGGSADQKMKKAKTTNKLTMLNLKNIGDSDTLDHEAILLDDYTYS